MLKCVLLRQNNVIQFNIETILPINQKAYQTIVVIKKGYNMFNYAKACLH